MSDATFHRTCLFVVYFLSAAKESSKESCARYDTSCIVRRATAAVIHDGRSALRPMTEAIK